jgi:hypothetical protein
MVLVKFVDAFPDIKFAESLEMLRIDGQVGLVSNLDILYVELVRVEPRVK